MAVWRVMLFLSILFKTADFSEKKFRPGKQHMQILAFIQVCDNQNKNNGHVHNYNYTVNNTNDNNKAIYTSQICKDSMD